MANPEHVRKLKQGTAVLNEYVQKVGKIDLWGADLWEAMSQATFNDAQDDRKKRGIVRGLVNLAKGAVGFATAVSAGLAVAAIGDPTAAHHILVQFHATLDKLLKIFH